MTDTARQLAPTRAHRYEFAVGRGRQVVGLRGSPGDSARGVVLLLPGYTGTKEDFAPILDPLTDAGFVAVALDLPGQYESPGPLEPDGYLPDALGVDVALTGAALRRAHPGIPLHLVGHSYGGLVARAAVLATPGGFDSLVLLDSGPAAIGGRRRALMEAMEPVLASHGVATVYAATLAAARQDPSWVAPLPALAEFLERRFLASPAVALAGMGSGIRTEPDRVDALVACGIPTAVIYGADDDAWPPAVQDAMAQRLGTRSVVIAGAGHSPAVERPAALVTALITFWAGIDR